MISCPCISLHVNTVMVRVFFNLYIWIEMHALSILRPKQLFPSGNTAVITPVSETLDNQSIMEYKP